MSFEDGWAAVNLEMPRRVPRTEFHCQRHWPLVRAVTGRRVDADSPRDVRDEAGRALMKAWNFDLLPNTDVSKMAFGDMRTDMGHASYYGDDKRERTFCPFHSPEEVIEFDPWETYGTKDRRSLISFIEERYARRCEDYPDAVNMSGVYITCVSGLIHIFGWDLLLTAAGLHPEGFGEMTRRYGDWVSQYYEALAETKVPVILMHDDFVIAGGAVFNPEYYRRYVFPIYKRLVEPLIANGKIVLFWSDGDYTAFIDDLADCGVSGFLMEPLTDLQTVAERYGQTHVIVGAADTRILLRGPRERIRAEVERCMTIGRNCPGFFMNVGNGIPPNTPVENALYYNEVYESLSAR